MQIKKYIPANAWMKARMAKYALERMMARCFWVFKIDNNKVVLSNFNGKGYGDSPRYIAEKLAVENKWSLYWLDKQGSGNYPEYITAVKYGSIRMIYHLATARVWILNTRGEPYFVKRRGQYYVQTWHGSLPLKKIEKDVEESLDKFYVYTAKRDSKMIDLMVSDSHFSDLLYGESFWYDGEVKRLGTARLDPLFNCSDTERIKNSLSIDKNAFVVLYAPTFRNDNRLDVYDLDIDAVRREFENKTGKKTEILVKMHPNIAAEQLEIYDHDVRNVSSYPDVYELMKISDVLITDYSSLLFEFGVHSLKPVFSYAKDLKSYDRGFYFEIGELPFDFADTNEELISRIRNFDREIYEKKVRQFYEKIELLADGKASERTADYIQKKTEK